MPFNIGLPEMMIILVIALIVFGPRKLPEIGGAVGKAMREFRRASSELTEELTREVEVEKAQARKAPEAESHAPTSYAPEQTQAHSPEPLTGASGPLLAPPPNSQGPLARAPGAHPKES